MKCRVSETSVQLVAGSFERWSYALFTHLLTKATSFSILCGECGTAIATKESQMSDESVQRSSCASSDLLPPDSCGSIEVLKILIQKCIPLGTRAAGVAVYYTNRTHKH